MKVDELDGALLDYWVAKVVMATFRGERPPIYRVTLTPGSCCINNLNPYTPSKCWSQGGPIIERERIMFHEVRNGEPGRQGNIRASVSRGMATTTYLQYGPTHLIAAMRCYVRSQFGEEVPDQQLGVSEEA
jgi:Protein of unknown function (DUF2591)